VALRALSSNGYPISAKMIERHPYLDPAEIPAGPKTLKTSNVFSKAGQVPYRKDFPTAIIVSHEASRTGAPILALNLARSLSTQLNIVSVILKDGELVADFQQASTAVYLVEAARGDMNPFNSLLDDIKAKLPPAFAIVNSIVSRHILEALREYQIPSVALLHEFASYTRPSSAFRDTFELADEIVFSCDLTLQNAIELTDYDMRSSRFHVLAQGRCAVPSGEEKDEQRQEERGLLTTRLRPYGEDAGEFLVIGAGTVQYRKGVDLFIDVARRVLSSESGQNARFAWIGSGFDTERDAAYSVYLQDQIRRAGLTDRMIILPATSEIEHVYALSSALLLTSRLDPLPNVAIDALSEGVPVVCFDKTTGIADLLIEADLGEACVAGYLDSADAAEKVLELIRSQETYRRTCERSKAFASRAFDFDLYATKIKELGLGARIY
jgi:glycosyltransferase involved in cell wall biosynthesis